MPRFIPLTQEEWECSPRWEARLSNGEYCWSDSKNSFKQLKEYCDNNDLYIVDFLYGNRDNVINLPSNKDGYFFRDGAFAVWNGPASQTITIGYMQNGSVCVDKYTSPDLQLLYSENRSIEECEELIVRRT